MSVIKEAIVPIYLLMLLISTVALNIIALERRRAPFLPRLAERLLCVIVRLQAIILLVEPADDMARLESRDHELRLI